MNADERDPLELERFAIVTRQRKLEQEGYRYPVPFCCYLYRVDGASFEIGFQSIELIAGFLNEISPVDCVFHVGKDEDVERLKQEIAEAATRTVH